MSSRACSDWINDREQRVMMKGIDAFSFIYGDAWYSGGWGYRSILEIGERKTVINWIVDGTAFYMDITDRATEFLSFLDKCGVMNWNGNNYYKFCEDGYQFALNIAYNGQSSSCIGSNGAPERFDLFMTGLHNEWGLPMSTLDGQKGFSWEWEIKDTIVEGFDTSRIGCLLSPWIM